MTKPVLTLPYNTKGRDFVVGDIHGIFDVLEDALRAVKFDPTRDRLISVGDLIDRGPLSHTVLHYLAQPWFHAIRGNHEQMFLYCMRDDTLDTAAVNNNIKNGFGWMLQQTPQHLMAIKAAFEKLPVAIQIEGDTGKPEDRIGFVHADVPQGMSWPQFVRELENGNQTVAKIAIWSRRRIETRDHSGVDGIARIFLGHTPQIGAQQLGNCFFIDTGGVFRFINKQVGPLYYLLLSETTAPARAITDPQSLTGKHFRAVQKPPAPPTPPAAPHNKPPRP